ncbi:hypothetical protein CSPX01_07712 [Colletotrichum filicis]|nr:hypothetical protein CSPX01_07712 [Colletotrichum filicis]
MSTMTSSRYFNIPLQVQLYAAS